MSAIFSSADKENQALITRINALIGRPFFKEGKYAVSKDLLPFYSETSLVKVINFATLPNTSKTFISSPSSLLKLDGTQEAIKEANDTFGLFLTKENVIRYASFFFSMLQTPDGKFKLIETVEDIPFSSAIEDELLHSLSELISPPTVKQEEDGFLITASILYGQTLYDAEVTVSKTGTVEIRNEEPVYDDLPVKRKKLR